MTAGGRRTCLARPRWAFQAAGGGAVAPLPGQGAAELAARPASVPPVRTGDVAQVPVLLTMDGAAVLETGMRGSAGGERLPHRIWAWTGAAFAAPDPDAARDRTRAEGAGPGPRL